MTTFGEEEKDDATFDAQLSALIEKARKDEVPDNHLGEIVIKFYRRHGRELPSPSALALRIKQ